MNPALLVARIYRELIAHDIFLWRHDFAALHRRVRGFALRTKSPSTFITEALFDALDLACSIYPVRPLCLQRSAVLVKMLRENGVAAQMVIGAQKLPFKAHAWVEVDGVIVNDRLASTENFLVLERC
jgi:hypothetical protein